MIQPYKVKSLKLNLISYVLSNFIHIIPASAPIGVINAAILEAMTLAKIAVEGALDKRLEKRTLIGILLIKFAVIVPAIP